jgi:crotonobetainyl-CoA:carnitine CoA-transferase CaiB-like acyl-CoA transferase
MIVAAMKAIEPIWRDAGLPAEALQHLALTGADPALPSSFAVGTAAQTTLAAAALGAAEVGAYRNGLRQQVSVDMRLAALECCCHFSVNGRTPELWDKLAGLYPCGDGGWVRLHTNFAHHRDGVLRLLGLPEGPDTQRDAVATALQSWRAHDFEDAAAGAGLVVAALRTFDEWDAHPHSAAVAQQPLVAIERIGDAAPIVLPVLPPLPLDASPLRGLRVLDLTRILAGPVGGRTLAAYGADVLLVNAPHLPNIDAIIDTSRGKLSALADLRGAAGRDALRAVLRDAHVLIQGYRPGALAAFGFGPEDVARERPGIVMVSLSAYGDSGPWAGRRGFDSLVQTATGFNHAEAQAAGSSKPRALPMQILDIATGFLIAFGAQAALLRQQHEGGSWHVRVSLARTGLWLRELGRVANGFDAPAADFAGLMETQASGYGELTAMRHAASFSHTAAGWSRPSMPPGTHPLVWPAH